MKLYIGNLPYNVREEELTELFAAIGAPRTTTVIVDHMRGRSRGFGFVEFDDPSQGKAAIASVHGKEFFGRTLTVNEARSQGGGPGDRRGPRRGGGDSGNRDDRGRGREDRY